MNSDFALNEVVLPQIPSPRQLRALRSWFGWSQQEAAAALGVSVSTIIIYETGVRAVTQATLNLIAVKFAQLGVRFSGTNLVLGE
ncbi:MAG: helix-turn-helix domain-containing protein [Tepidisphaeraceae bacterium]